MQQPPINFETLNLTYSVEEYLLLSDEERIAFKGGLKKCIKELKKQYHLKWMTKEDVLTVGLKASNRIAIAISILTEMADSNNYDRFFHFRETISILRKQLLEDLYGGKTIFYAIDDTTVGLDPNYIPFILGKGIPKLRKL